jgi:hypothetical protein
LDNRKIFHPTFIQFEEGQWSVFKSDFAELGQKSIDLQETTSIIAPGGWNNISINTMTIPLVDKTPLTSKEFLTLNELYKNITPRYLGEIIWRVGLIFQCWIVVFPFRSLAPNDHYRKKYSSDQIGSLSFFSISLMILFLFSKLPVILQG